MPSPRFDAMVKALIEADFNEAERLFVQMVDDRIAAEREDQGSGDDPRALPSGSRQEGAPPGPPDEDLLDLGVQVDPRPPGRRVCHESWMDGSGHPGGGSGAKPPDKIKCQESGCERMGFFIPGILTPIEEHPTYCPDHEEATTKEQQDRDLEEALDLAGEAIAGSLKAVAEVMGSHKEGSLTWLLQTVHDAGGARVDFGTQLIGLEVWGEQVKDCKGTWKFFLWGMPVKDKDCEAPTEFRAPRPSGRPVGWIKLEAGTSHKDCIWYVYRPLSDKAALLAAIGILEVGEVADKKIEVTAPTLGGNPWVIRSYNEITFCFCWKIHVDPLSGHARRIK